MTAGKTLKSPSVQTVAVGPVRSNGNRVMSEDQKTNISTK